jgi:hypothetical protein
MRTLIPDARTLLTRRASLEWIDEVVRVIGPGFHFDTRPEEYVSGSGGRLLDQPDSHRVRLGLREARKRLGTDRFELACLHAVWREMGVQYDTTLGQLSPITASCNG